MGGHCRGSPLTAEPPEFVSPTSPLLFHYHQWHTVLLQKAYRPCTGTQEAITPERHTQLCELKPSLDAWKKAVTGWLLEPWITTISTAQLDAIYCVLYDLALQAFKLNALPKKGQTCQAAVKATVRVGSAI